VRLQTPPQRDEGVCDMLILKVLAGWSAIAIITALLAGEAVRRMGSATTGQRLAVILHPARVGVMRRTSSDTRGNR
jgi:hypothetical protein